MERIWGEGGKRKQGDTARYREICKGIELLDPIIMWVQCSLWKVREPTLHMIIEKISHDLFAIPSSRIFSFFLVTFIVSSLIPLLNRPDWTTIFRTAFCFQNMFSTIITESSCISVWITIIKKDLLGILRFKSFGVVTVVFNSRNVLTRRELVLV